MSLWILSSINKGGFPLKASSKYYYNGTKKTSLPLSAVSLIFLTSSIFIFEDDASLFLDEKRHPAFEEEIGSPGMVRLLHNL
jgi:hypothetical protein